MSYGRTCHTTVHVFRIACITLGCVFLEDMSYLRVCFIGGHVYQADMSYKSAYFTGWHILQDDLSYGRTGGHVLYKVMFYRWTCFCRSMCVMRGHITERHDLK